MKCHTGATPTALDLADPQLPTAWAVCGFPGPLRRREVLYEVQAPVTSAYSEVREAKSPALAGPFADGRYWARTSDLRLVEAALSQLS
ncbi:MAG: hypothetical protein JWO21_1836 [Solirubrobacterales bacterium]|nr:hypothetical protein [Solirubrobacterales bacterium]